MDYNAQQFVSVKAELMSMLKTRRLSALPFGFPFRCLPGVSEKFEDALPDLSCSSYEFLQAVFVDATSPPTNAVFSYTAPAYEPAKSAASCSKMVWRISIPHPSQPCGHFTTVAQVELDPAVLEKYLCEIMNEKLVLDALALSLEHAVHVTMQLALTSHEAEAWSEDRKDYQNGDLVLVAKTNDGRQSHGVIHVYHV